MTAILPPAITPAEFGQAYQLPAAQVHRAVDRLPQECKFRLGRRIRILVEPLKAWIEAGGSL